MTEELKKALEAAKTEEEAKAVAEKFKDEIKKLTPEELEGVTGGSFGMPDFDSALRNELYKMSDEELDRFFGGN